MNWCVATAKTPSLSCRTGCGHTRLLVNVARNDISELGFNQTLVSGVPVNYLWLYDGMSLHLFLCYTQENFLVNCNKWRIVFIDGYNCLPDRWVMQVRILTFSCNHFLSVCMFMYKCHLMLISVNTVDSTRTFILHGARVQGNFYYL